MPFLAQTHVDIPESDILSWYFDKPSYDLDQKIYVDAVNDARSYTGREAKTIIRRLAAGFRAAGLKEGDVVGVHSYSDIDYSVLVNGIVAFGGIFAGTNPAYTKYELVHHMKTCRSRLLIVEKELLPVAVAAAEEAGLPQERILVFNHDKSDAPTEGLKSWRSLLQYGESDWVRFKGEEARRRPAAYLTTSGTTGLPKAAILSHFNLVAQHTLVYEHVSRPYEISRIVAMPMFHAAIVPSGHFTPLRSGHTTYVLRRFEVEPFLAAIEKQRITEIPTVPPIVLAIINSPLAKKYNYDHVRKVTCGAAPLGKEAQARLLALMGPEAVFTQVWGMTEISCIGSMFGPMESDDTGSVGRMLPGIDAKLVDDDQRDISGYDVPGELCVRGPLVISGYFENPEANQRDWDADGYFHTGDVAVCSSKTKTWYIVDRKKELIKVRGFQVAPPELESVLLSHPQIVDAAVIGVTPNTADASEVPRAYVRKRDSPEAQRLDEKEVYDLVANKMAKFKKLDGGVVFVDEIPKNPSGKILKRVLREWAKKEMGAKL